MDTQLSDLVCLKLCRADKAVGAVSAGSIVVHFDVLEYSLSHLLPGDESLTVNGLDLERVEKALGTGIIVTIALRTHAAEQLVLPDQLLEGAGCERGRTTAIHRVLWGAFFVPEIASNHRVIV